MLDRYCEKFTDDRSGCGALGLSGDLIITDLIQLIYFSQPFGYDEPTLSGILLDARRCNARDGITGALVCRHDVFLQLLEGPEQPVQAAFQRISRDDRHTNIKKLVSQPTHHRIFGDWAMLHDPADSLIWTKQEIEDGALEKASQDDIVSMFESLAVRVRTDTPT